MPVVLQSGIMKVGNSEVLLLPKALSGTFKIEKGDKVSIIVQDDGFFVPLEQRKDVSELLERYRKREKEPAIEESKEAK